MSAALALSPPIEAVTPVPVVRSSYPEPLPARARIGPVLIDRVVQAVEHGFVYRGWDTANGEAVELFEYLPPWIRYRHRLAARVHVKQAQMVAAAVAGLTGIRSVFGHYGALLIVMDGLDPAHRADVIERAAAVDPITRRGLEAGDIAILGVATAGVWAIWPPLWAAAEVLLAFPVLLIGAALHGGSLLYACWLAEASRGVRRGLLAAATLFAVATPWLASGEMLASGWWQRRFLPFADLAVDLRPTRLDFVDLGRSLDTTLGRLFDAAQHFLYKGLNFQPGAFTDYVSAGALVDTPPDRLFQLVLLFAIAHLVVALVVAIAASRRARSDLPLGTAPEEPGVLEQPPRRPTMPVLLTLAREMPASLVTATLLLLGLATTVIAFFFVLADRQVGVLSQPLAVVPLTPLVPQPTCPVPWPGSSFVVLAFYGVEMIFVLAFLDYLFVLFRQCARAPILKAALQLSLGGLILVHTAAMSAAFTAVHAKDCHWWYRDGSLLAPSLDTITVTSWLMPILFVWVVATVDLLRRAEAARPPLSRW